MIKSINSQTKCPFFTIQKKIRIFVNEEKKNIRGTNWGRRRREKNEKKEKKKKKKGKKTKKKKKKKSQMYQEL